MSALRVSWLILPLRKVNGTPSATGLEGSPDSSLVGDDTSDDDDLVDRDVEDLVELDGNGEGVEVVSAAGASMKKSSASDSTSLAADAEYPLSEERKRRAE